MERKETIRSAYRMTGGKRNFHNGVGDTYDCIAIISYYVICKAISSFR